MEGRSGERRKGGGCTLERGADACVPTASVTAPVDDAETRIISLSGGVDWLVTVVARLVVEDVGRSTAGARLVVRIECLTHPYRTVRVATVRARTLRTVDERRLRTLIRVPAIRSRYPMRDRRQRGAKGGV
jgi:hypothetical protein